MITYIVFILCRGRTNRLNYVICNLFLIFGETENGGRTGFSGFQGTMYGICLAVNITLLKSVSQIS